MAAVAPNKRRKGELPVRLSSQLLPKAVGAVPSSQPARHNCSRSPPTNPAARTTSGALRLGIGRHAGGALPQATQLHGLTSVLIPGACRASIHGVAARSNARLHPQHREPCSTDSPLLFASSSNRERGESENHRLCFLLS